MAAEGYGAKQDAVARVAAKGAAETVAG